MVLEYTCTRVPWYSSTFLFAKISFRKIAAPVKLVN